jgi:NTE family protein
MVLNSIGQDKLKIQKSKRPSVGLVMSGGGAKGFAYIGLLKVIQEAGLRVDYVAGTSIGSIIAGLYALGYHPDSIQKIIETENWDMVLNDEIPRKDLAFEEKEFGEKFIVSLPLNEKKINMMASLHEGQEVDQLLNYYLSPAYKISDFSNLNIPFLCIGTDLLNGESVELNKGYLPDAIRASMSIPGYFSPKEYDGRYLVDGGVVNNYPVINVKQQGVDIIVGADVQSGLKDDISKLNTVASVIDQIIGFYRVEANNEGYAATNIYIHIPMNYGMMEFTSYDSIMAAGEKIGRENFGKIKALADSLNAIEYRPLREYKTQPLDSIYVNEVFIVGNKKMPFIYFKDLVDDYSNSYVNLLDLRERVTEMYGTRFFKHINYKFKQENGKNNIYFYVSESDPGYLSAAVHYDMDYQGSILANLSARNILGKRSKLFVDIVLGTNPRLKAMYSISNLQAFGVGAILDVYSFGFNDYEKDVKSGKLDFSNLSFSLFGHKNFKNKFALRIGLKYEYFQAKQDVVTDTNLVKYEKFSSYGTPFLSFNVDTYNHHYYPTRGIKAEFKVKYIMPWSDNSLREVIKSSAMIYLKYDQNISISPKLTARPGLFGAVTFKQDMHPPLQHWIGVGGLNPNNYVENHVSFTGVNFVQSWGYYSWIGRMKLQYQLLKKIYLIARADVGINVLELNQINNFDKTMFGYGMSASYDSFIGPIELTIMGSNLNPDPTFFINVGFWL